MKPAFLIWISCIACSPLASAPSFAASDYSSECILYTAFAEDDAVRKRWEDDLLAANVHYLRAPDRVVESVWIHGAASWGPGHDLSQEFHISFEQLAEQRWRVHLTRPIKETFGEQIVQVYPMQKMSERFCAFGSSGSDPRWIAERERLLPPQADVLARLIVERASADSDSCPQIVTQLGRFDAAQIATSERPGKYDPSETTLDGPTLPIIGTTAPKNGIAVIRSQAVLAWAEETMSALKPCWVPNTAK